LVEGKKNFITLNDFPANDFLKFSSEMVLFCNSSGRLHLWTNQLS